ncbi:MAG: hypothetical protein NC127_00030 [Muribaculum sp.]|nr:hypothetical protein [Muribaculum sp.]
MKKTLYFFAATAMLATMASCSNEEIVNPVEGTDGNVVFSVALPSQAYGSRAFADGKSADRLDYAVYDASSGNLVSTGNTSFNNSLQTTVSLSLANGKSYNIAFFASNNGSDGGAYTFNADQKTVSVDYTKMTTYNSSDYDAFYNVTNTGTITGPLNQEVTLKRPLAQINWGTRDLAEAAVTAADMYGADAANLVTKVTVKEVYTGFNLLDGKMVGDATDITFSSLARPDASQETFPVKPTTYKYLSMNYVLVPSTQSLVEAELTPSNGTKDFQSVKVTNLPVQANYRTNIYGALLTNPTDFTVTKDNEYETPDYTPVASAEEMIAAVANGGTLVMSDDIELTEQLPLSADKPVVIDTKGNKLIVSSQQTVAAGQSLSIINSDAPNVASAVSRSQSTLSEVTITNQKGFYASSNSTLTIENVVLRQTYTGTKVAGIVDLMGSNIEASLKNCVIVPSITNTYAITTNANNGDKNINLTLDNVQVKPTAIIACPVLFNVEMEVIATNCVFEGCNTPIILRGGNYDFTNCTFRQTLAFNESGACTTLKADIKKTFRPLYRAGWGTGTNVPLAGIIIGNNNKAYQYPTTVNLKGCTIEIPTVAQNTDNDLSSSLPAVYAYANQGEGLGVTFNYDEATAFNGALEFASSNITVNGQQLQNYTEQ